MYQIEIDSKMEDAYNKAISKYCNQQHITGVDIGYKYRGLKNLEYLSIRVFVEQKIEESKLEPGQIIPDTFMGFPTDVIQARHRLPDNASSVSMSPENSAPITTDRTTKIRPLVGGVSTAHICSNGSGTLGAIVQKDRKRMILSNWHVLTLKGIAQLGDNITQPAFPYRGSDSGIVATLDQHFFDQDGDAAIAKINDDIQADAKLIESGLKLIQPRPVQCGEKLEKSGAATCTTQARVDGIGCYFYEISGRNQLVDGFRLLPLDHPDYNGPHISHSGDSGAVWYDPSSLEAVGLNISGEQREHGEFEFAIACHMTRVQRRLQITFP